MTGAVSLAGDGTATRRPAEILRGMVERVTYHDPGNGFVVLRVSVQGRRQPVTVVGHAAGPSPGEGITAIGGWYIDPAHGQQFRADTLELAAPTSEDGIERFLASGIVPGIGARTACKLVAAFGSVVFDVIEHQPARLRAIPGIGQRRAARILAGWAEQKAVREIMLFLQRHGVGGARAVRIHRTYGAEAIRVMSEDPYRLARDIRGIGFHTADAIAQRLGIAHGAMPRLRAGLRHVLAEAMAEGHCGLPEEEVAARASELLDVDAALIDESLAAERAERLIIADEAGGRPFLFLAGLHRAERAIAARLLALAAKPAPWAPIDASAALSEAETALGCSLAGGQRDAVVRAIASRLLVVTGGPGTGKTTILKAILSVLGARDVRVLLAAPTGRAARRMSEATGREATTIHRLLGLQPDADQPAGGHRQTLACDLLVVDEASMVDVPLMHGLLRALPPNAALMLIGDADQLPSVGPGQVLADIIASGAVPVVRLTEVHRQAAGSRIVEVARAVHQGRMPDLSRRDAKYDLHFLAVEDPADVAARIVDRVARHIPARLGVDPVRDIQVLCPMNRGEAGTRALNLALQQALNHDARPAVERFGWRFAPGDKVMQTENDPRRDVSNGDIGFVERVDPADGELTVSFDGRRVTYAFGELDALVPAYAITVHKAQGSEFPVVVLPLSLQHYAMLRRDLLYTAITRGRRLVVLVGSKRAISSAVRGARNSGRLTRLREQLERSGGGAG